MTSWDEIYAQSEAWGSTLPSTFLLDFVEEGTGIGKRVLDLGSGEGRNALLFARSKTQIDCVDISATALSRLRKLSHDLDATVSTHQANILDFQVETGNYDVVLFYGVINSFPKNQWKSLADKIKASLRPGGVAIVVVFTDLIPILEHEPTLVSLAEAAEMRELFAGLSVIKASAHLVDHCHFPKGNHSHSIERYAFRNSIVTMREPTEPTGLKVAVLAPTNPSYSAAALRVKDSSYHKAAADLGHFMADRNIEYVGVPDRGLPLLCLEALLERRPDARATILVPPAGDGLSNRGEFDLKDIINRFPLAEFNVVKSAGWADQVVKISQLADACVAIGHSCGSIVEIGWTKWTKKPVFASRDLCSPLPREIQDRLHYFEVPTFEQLLRTLSMHLPYVKENVMNQAPE
jgi:2-polyprenyl-3-methyl-5-hydroxy-6-metoxy-1,4-benzoquinol methylase